MDERRRHQRVERYFECAWHSEWGEEHSRASNLSEGGCYVESRRAVSQGTRLPAITIMLPTGEITVQGVVVHAIRGVGFAVQFAAVDAEARARLSALAQL
ncbi:MAG TPA: PilZ domain-containing protein [Vicinamibacterales bacterium]|nr:PilZ domain-containing protein [Vicinamibacterales bacterium]